MENTFEMISNSLKSSKHLKIVTYIVIGIAGLYITGHVLKIAAHTIRGFKDFSSALKE